MVIGGGHRLRVAVLSETFRLHGRGVACVFDEVPRSSGDLLHSALWTRCASGSHQPGTRWWSALERKGMMFDADCLALTSERHILVSARPPRIIRSGRDEPTADGASEFRLRRTRRSGERTAASAARALFKVVRVALQVCVLRLAAEEQGEAVARIIAQSRGGACAGVGPPSQPAAVTVRDRIGEHKPVRPAPQVISSRKPRMERIWEEDVWAQAEDPSVRFWEHVRRTLEQRATLRIAAFGTLAVGARWMGRVFASGFHMQHAHGGSLQYLRSSERADVDTIWWRIHEGIDVRLQWEYDVLHEMRTKTRLCKRAEGARQADADCVGCRHFCNLSRRLRLVTRS
eukprot:726629-Prymnesium_polylepis.1